MIRTCPVNFAGIPPAMQKEKRWGLWRYEDVKGRLTKVPYRTNGTAKADSTDPDSWGHWPEACAALIRRRDADGLAFQLGDGWSGVDLDKCRDKETGVFEEWAEEILMKLNSYTEVSPSGTGAKVFLFGQIPGTRRRTGRFEMYDSGRYFTVTGNRLELVSEEVEERNTELAELYKEMFPPTPEPNLRTAPSTADNDILRLAFKSKNGRQIESLYQGDLTEHGSASEADLALCSHLAFFAGGDPHKVDALFRASGLMRPKWDERHGGQTYGAMTIGKAISEMRQFYGDGKPPPNRRPAYAGVIGIE